MTPMGNTNENVNNAHNSHNSHNSHDSRLTHGQRMPASTHHHSLQPVRETGVEEMEGGGESLAQAVFGTVNDNDNSVSNIDD